MTPSPIPADFPHAVPAGAVPGAQHKLLAREEGCRFVAGPSEADVRARYVMCEDLAHQLVAYSARKRPDNAERSEAQLGVQVARAVRQMAFGWGLSPAETEWLLRHVDALTITNAPKDLK